MEYKKVGIELELLPKLGTNQSVSAELKSLESSFSFYGTLKEIITENENVFKDSKHGQNGKSEIAKLIIDNDFTLPESFISAKSKIF